MIKKDLPTLLKLRAEHNLDDKWFIDRVEEMMLEVIGSEEPLRKITGGEEIFFGKNIIRNKLRGQQKKRLYVLLGK